ncbi:MAG TPA: TlpA family protein disulfide reductase [Planctomycetaceae bacterium]|nr:TlpA family protein disulfide reductase [Planctomycetaceae bacterium]
MRIFVCALCLVATVAYTSLAAAEKKKVSGKTKVKTIAKVEAKTVDIGKQAPAFKIKSSDGKLIDLAELTKKGPVLVRLTCGCSGCDKELAYFQALHAAYKSKGLTSLAIFREPDEKVEKYVKTKKLNMLYAVDTKGASWSIFQTKTMPSNFLIEKGGRIRAIATGCEPSGLIAEALSKKVASLLETETADVRKKNLKK